MRKILIPTIALVAIIVSYNLMQENPIKQNEPSAKTNTNKIDDNSAIVNIDNTILKQSEDSSKTSSINNKSANPAGTAYAKTNYKALEEGYGLTPATTNQEIAASPQLASAVEAAKNPKENATQLSLLAKPLPFEKNRYLNDKEYKKQYLSTAEPARVYQSDSSSKYTLKRLSHYYQEVEQGNFTHIVVQGEPNMPISLTSLDLGKLGNGLTHQTIEADINGEAKFTFYGMPGTIADTKLLASGPTCRGQLKFIVNTTFKK